MGTPNLLVILATGLLAGGLTCLAAQGGLLVSTIAGQEETDLSDHAGKGNARPIFYFLLAKLGAYSLLGFFLGWLGSLLQPSLTVKIILQVAVIIFMIGTAFKLLNIHPIFQVFTIKPPVAFRRLLERQKNKGAFAPLLLGAFTVLIPCGTTQAMMALAITSGNAWFGSLILFTFVLGTSPLFFIFGYVTQKLTTLHHRKFLKGVGVAILVLAAYNLYGTAVLAYGVFGTTKNEANMSVVPVSNITISLANNGYRYQNLNVRAGTKVSLSLVNENAWGCIQSFTIPKLGIQKIIPTKTTQKISFIAPQEPQKLLFSCSMGMYRGYINVL